MGILHTDLPPNRRKAASTQRGGSVSTETARALAENPSLPIMNRPKAVIKAIAPENAAKRLSNDNRPLVVYDSAPLNQVLERISFKKKPRGNKEGAGVRLTL